MQGPNVGTISLVFAILLSAGAVSSSAPAECLLSFFVNWGLTCLLSLSCDTRIKSPPKENFEILLDIAEVTTTWLSLAVVWDDKVVIGDSVAAFLAVRKKLVHLVYVAE